MSRPSTSMRSVAGSASVPTSRTTAPLTATRPAAMSSSALRRDVSPAWARILFSLSVAIGGDGHVRHDQLALDLRQIGQVAQPEGNEELTRGLVEERAARRFLAAGDADESPLEQVVDHALGV